MRGRLRVYLGCAPGVGKTFAMLDEGHRRAERGTDVVIALVETHGREHTAAKVEGLEVVPRRTVEYRGATFAELDLDAVLARRPQVALVDELAHTNVPGVGNAKRWEDVEVLLAAGIDVVTTVNVQHLESLNDVVAEITGVPQRETVPDTVVRSADQVELVDMSPESLRRRMAHGNVYAPEKVDAALGNYFRVGNLTALRELALVWLAGSVDDELQKYRVQHGIDATWDTPRTQRGGDHRRTRGRDAAAARGADRRPRRRCRPDGAARLAQRRPRRRRCRRAGRAAAAGRRSRRQLSLGGRRGPADGDPRVRAVGRRHAGRARGEPPRAAGHRADRPGQRRDHHAAVGTHRRPRRQP